MSLTLSTPETPSLAEIKILEDAPPDIIAQVERCCRWSEYDEGDVVIDQKDVGTSVFFIAKGRLRVIDFMVEDQEVSLADLEPGDTFGELSAVDLKVRSARVTALEPTVLAEVNSDDFHKLLLDCPTVTFSLLKRFANIIRNMTSRVTAMSTLSPHQRIYNELLRLAEPDTTVDGVWIISNVPNHVELSSWVGVDKQTVADAIGNLARSRVVERKHRNLIIRDHARLQRLVSQ